MLCQLVSTGVIASTSRKMSSGGAASAIDITLEGATSVSRKMSLGALLRHDAKSLVVETETP